MITDDIKMWYTCSVLFYLSIISLVSQMRLKLSLVIIIVIIIIIIIIIIMIMIIIIKRFLKCLYFFVVGSDINRAMTLIST